MSDKKDQELISRITSAVMGHYQAEVSAAQASPNKPKAAKKQTRSVSPTKRSQNEASATSN